MRFCACTSCTHFPSTGEIHWFYLGLYRPRLLGDVSSRPGALFCCTSQVLFTFCSGRHTSLNPPATKIIRVVAMGFVARRTFCLLSFPSWLDGHSHGTYIASLSLRAQPSKLRWIPLNMHLLRRHIHEEMSSL